MACSSEDLKASGPQGPAIYLLHYKDDALYETGPKEPLPAIYDETK